MSETIVFISGKPGAGKSSRCRDAVLSAEEWAGKVPVRHLSVGRRCRAIIAGEVESQHAEAVNECSNTVLNLALPPYALVHAVVEEYITMQDQPGITLLDGYPKEPQLLPLIERSIQESVMCVKGCIALLVDDDTAIDRQIARDSSSDFHPTCSRLIAVRRVSEHNISTAPVLRELMSVYGGESVDAERSAEHVSEDFIGALASCVHHGMC